jgi:hypothetical protein
MEDRRLETPRLPYFLDNQLTDGGEAVNLTRRAFLLEAESTPGYLKY